MPETRQAVFEPVITRTSQFRVSNTLTPKSKSPTEMSDSPTTKPKADGDSEPFYADFSKDKEKRWWLPPGFARARQGLGQGQGDPRFDENAEMTWM
jgi:hypothetical protein